MTTTTDQFEETTSMSDNEDGKLPARSRKAVDATAQAAREQAPAVGVNPLRHLQAAIEATEDDESS
jgi:hypothetical protein